jgi:hypothetical protein
MRPACIACGVSPPDTNTEYTLISRSGWRLTRCQGPDGALRTEWRCRKCWTLHRLTLKAVSDGKTQSPRETVPPTGAEAVGFADSAGGAFSKSRSKLPS